MARSTVCHCRDARGKEGKEKRKEKGNKDRDREIRENEGGEKEKAPHLRAITRAENWPVWV